MRTPPPFPSGSHDRPAPSPESASPRRRPAGLRARIRPALALFASIAALSAPAQALAQEYPARDIGGWTVAASTDKKGCFVTRTYDGAGRTTLLLGLDMDDTNHLSVLNDNWSIRPKERLDLNFRLTTGGYSNHFAIGIASDGKRGFVTDFEPKFPAYFAASKALHISRGDVPVAQLSLDGSAAAIVELRRCVGIHRAAATSGAREEERSSSIPKDPFAPASERKPKK